MDSPFDRRDFLEGAAGTLALLLSRQGLAAAQAPRRRAPRARRLRTQRLVRFDECKREMVA